MSTAIRLSWKRVEKAARAGDADTVDEFVVADASLVHKGSSWYVTYFDPQANRPSRTTLKMEQDALTMIRHGEVEWRHVFREGENYHSTMRIQTMNLPIETTTHRIQCDVGEEQGTLFVDYSIRMGDDTKRVLLEIQFAATEPSAEF